MAGAGERRGVFNFDIVKRAIGDVGAQLKKLRAEREDAMRQREDLQSLPLARADYQELLENWIDRQGAGFKERLQTATTYYLRNPMAAALPENPKAPVHPLAILTACKNSGDMATIGGLECNLFYVLAPQIKEGIRRALDEMDFADAGPPRAERLQMIEALDAKIIACDEQEKELVEAAEASGLRL
jgi:hypothetical protein